MAHLDKKSGFTLIELLVVIAIIALLLSILLPSLRMAKEQAQRVVCTANLRSMNQAWLLYAEDNGGRVVSASHIEYNSSGAFAGWGWVGDTSGLRAEEEQLQGIRDGKLYPYCEDTGVYRCPTADPYQMRSYAMSSQWYSKYYYYSGDLPLGNTKAQIVIKVSNTRSPCARFTFVDNIAMNGDGYWAVPYNKPAWWNLPNYRHNGGTVNAFADGHAEAYKWTNKELTVKRARDSYEWAKANNSASVYMLDNTDQDKNEDLKWVQRSVWGKIGY